MFTQLVDKSKQTTKKRGWTCSAYSFLSLTVWNKSQWSQASGNFTTCEGSVGCQSESECELIEYFHSTDTSKTWQSRAIWEWLQQVDFLLHYILQSLCLCRFTFLAGFFKLYTPFYLLSLYYSHTHTHTNTLNLIPFLRGVFHVDRLKYKLFRLLPTGCDFTHTEGRGCQYELCEKRWRQAWKDRMGRTWN